MSQSKPRSEYYYEVYLYSEPYFMLLEDESIIDINLKSENYNYKESRRKFGATVPKKYIEFEYNDVFFDFNLKNSKRLIFSVVVVVYNATGQFLQQMDLLGEDLITENNKFRLYYEQITNNGAFASINPKWGNAIDLYKRERVSYLRDKKIDTLLNK